jgi:DNA-binding CsgD family transcriptional regulator
MNRFLTIDRLPTHVALLDSRGVILDVNEAWRQFGVENGLQRSGHGVGENYCELVSNALGPRHRLTLDLNALLAGRNALLTFTYPCHAPDRQRWFNLIGVLLGPSASARAALVHQEITSLLPDGADAASPPPDTSRAALLPDLPQISSVDERWPLLPASREASGLASLARPLTARQREVLRLIGQGLTNAEIARALALAPNTVKAHTSAIVRRLNLKSRTQAALLAGRLQTSARPRR